MRHNNYGRNVYIGKWEAPILNAIEYDFTAENAKKIIQFAIDEENVFTHKDIADWCYKYWVKYHDLDNSNEVEKVIEVMLDIDAQWDMNLSNTYSLKELQVLDFKKVNLPKEWFISWMDKLKAI